MSVNQAEPAEGNPLPEIITGCLEGESIDLSILGGKLEENHHFTVTTESSI